ncbi:hypothetical protein MY04_4830 [Flammeovirga sp. MY04]|uniref:hypothetical protein n=1 Tax=Flammeovirga sp. MY04 TaxID=1191459 RepID=UPI0008061CEC|nr:hypothetical protein [Flammeovirga sp. MY04]ANQ52165.1 hypothetical protein MY04_4830 [Flammeovirga sp. MY04]
MATNNIQKDLFESIQSENKENLFQVLSSIIDREDETPFWVESFHKVLLDFEKSTHLKTDEQYWLDVKRAFIDVIPR